MPFDQLKRRQFIALLGGAAAWPLAARAQQAGKLRTIGFSGQSTRSAESELVAAFTQRLRELGWIEGRTITIEYRWGEGREERCRTANQVRSHHQSDHRQGPQLDNPRSVSPARQRADRVRMLFAALRMSGPGIVSRVTPVHTAVRNCTRDEGRPFEVGNQVLISSHRKLLSSKATVVNVAEKSERDFGRYD